MACCKVPIKIAGFSGGCARVTDNALIPALVKLTEIDATTFQVSGAPIRDLAFLGLKCVNIACPPNLVVKDTLGDLVAFLDAQLTSTIDTNVTLGALAITDGELLIKNGLARLIAGCGGCCSA